MLKTPFISLMRASLKQRKQALFGRRWWPQVEQLDRQQKLTGWDQAALSACQLAVIGAGALGGNFAYWSVRAGVGEVWLFDDDEVGISNLPRQPFSHVDVGINKAIALRYHLRRVRASRDTAIRAFPYRFEETVEGGLASVPDILFVGVDNDLSRRWIVTYALHHHIPAIITGIDGEAAAGYVFAQQSQPETPCPACFWPSLAESRAQGACAPMSAGIALAIVGISMMALESLVMNRPRNWDAKTISLVGGAEGSYRVMKRSSCRLCASGSRVAGEKKSTEKKG